MSAESAAALQIAMGDYRVTGDAAALQEAAQGHLAASRELETVLGEYTALQQARDAGDVAAGAALGELAAELQPLREAREIAGGNLPGGGHAAAAGIGD